jgi:Ca2+-binding EF-hand superfamily protein
MKTSVAGVLALLVVCSTYATDQRRRVSFAELDKNSDGRVSVTEATASPKLNKAFTVADQDHDDYISEREFQTWVDSLATQKTSQLSAFETARLDMVRLEPPRAERW